MCGWNFLKPIKPWLARRTSSSPTRAPTCPPISSRRVVSLLKSGGRLGYISSSTFFRTASGKKLRLLLSERTDIETVIDFGDVQVFEGVTLNLSSNY